MPSSWKAKLRGVVRKVLPSAKVPRGEQRRILRESTEFDQVGPPGPMAELFDKIKGYRGWFNLDDCSTFHTLLSYQTATGIKGDLLEIGSYHGRSTAVLANCLGSGERIIVCDAFEADTEDPYSDRPSPELLRGNVTAVNPNLPEESLDIHACLSNELKLEPGLQLRFAHIDGGHSEEIAYSDLELCAPHITPSGIMVLDDYDHAMFPGVTLAAKRFLAEHPEFTVFADLNRHGAIGRKLYMVKRPST